MNAKQVYHNYLETFWETLQNYDLVMLLKSPYQKSYYSNELIICNNSEFNKVAEESSHYSHNKTKYAEIIAINTFNDFLEHTKSEEKNTIKKSISNNITYVRHNTNTYQSNSFITDLNAEVILNTMKKIGRDDDKHIFDNLKNMFIRYGDTQKTCWKLVTSVNDKYGKEKGMELLNAIPGQIFDFSSREKLKEYILEYFTKIEKVFGKNHELFLNFVSKRAKKAVNSQTGSVDLRDALLEFYQHDSNLLEDYKEFVPSIKKYLEQTEDGDFFLQKSDRIITRIIDLEEFKAVTSIRINSNDKYAQLITTFLRTLRLIDKRLVNHYSSTSWLNRRDNYISIFVACNPKNPYPEADFDIKLKSFAKFLHQKNPSEPNEISSDLLIKWWEADELDRELKKQGQKSKKTKL